LKLKPVKSLKSSSWNVPVRKTGDVYCNLVSNGCLHAA